MKLILIGYAMVVAVAVGAACAPSRPPAAVPPVVAAGAHQTEILPAVPSAVPADTVATDDVPLLISRRDDPVEIKVGQVVAFRRPASVDRWAVSFGDTILEPLFDADASPSPEVFRLKAKAVGESDLTFTSVAQTDGPRGAAPQVMRFTFTIHVVR